MEEYIKTLDQKEEQDILDFEDTENDELSALREFESGKYTKETCPECDSENIAIKTYLDELDRYREEMVCKDCGYTEV